jgi:hypothetical protein
MTPHARASRSSLIALLLVCGTLANAHRWGAYVAGGSDSYCYLAQARMWREGTLLTPSAPPFDASWSHAALSLAPVGFVPSTTVPGGLAPICPPGLGALMGAAEIVAGGRASLALVPLFGALAVWCAFVLGRALAGPWAGVLAALLTLASPIFLFQLLQPMSDVPAAALMAAAMAAGANRSGRSWRPVVSGLCAGLAVLVRPNLAPLLIGVAMLQVPWSAASRPDVRAPRFGPWGGLPWFAAGVLPPLVATVTLNAWLYGSPLASGYGDPRQLFSVSHVAPNLHRYGRWLLETQTPWILVALLAPWTFRRHAGPRSASGERAALSVACIVVTALLAAIYLPYVVFEDWSYLRFLLPGIVLLIALASAVTVAVLARLRWPFGAVLACALSAGLLVSSLHAAEARGVLAVRDSESRFVEAATWIRDHLPEEAVILTVWHSGAVRYYGGKPSVLWDALEPSELGSVLDALAHDGRRPYLLFETWEEPRFRERFAGRHPSAALDWPPRAQIGRDVPIKDPAARDDYFQGRPVGTERVWTAAERRTFGRR